MSSSFDPYHQWLGIPPQEQPPHHYRLLGVGLFEDKPTVIEHSADQRMGHLRTFQAGKYSALSQKLLNEVAAAKLCLLNPEKKAAYDAKLCAALAAQGESSEDSFGRQMAELVADAKPTRTPAKRTAVPVVMLAGAGLGFLILGLALWAYFAGWAERIPPIGLKFSTALCSRARGKGRHSQATRGAAARSRAVKDKHAARGASRRED